MIILGKRMKLSLTRLHLAGFVLAAFVAALDQWSKKWIVAAGEAGRLPVTILPFFNVTVVFNKGISFGMLAYSKGLVMTMLPIVLGTITLMLCVWLVNARKAQVIMALGLVVGGAVGNLIDRVYSGVVTDFLDFHIGRYHWPAFNLADSSIFIGVVIFAITNIIHADNNGETSE